MSRDTEESKKGPTLLLVVGADTYQIACNLCSPGLPLTKSYEELKTLLLGCFKPKVNVVAQHFHFHKRLQGPGESVNAYMSSLQQMASACELGEFLNDALRNQLVCGLACDKVQGWCLAATNLTLEKAFELASMMEGAQEGLMWLHDATDECCDISSASEPTVANFLTCNNLQTSKSCPSISIYWVCFIIFAKGVCKSSGQDLPEARYQTQVDRSGAQTAKSKRHAW